MRKRTWLPYAGVGLCAFLVYLLTLSRNLVASHDSVEYINGIDSHVWFFHPHHLLYHVAAMLWLSLFQTFGVTTDSALIVESLNALFGAATVALIFYILKEKFGNSTKNALSTTVLIACSFGFWYYSLNVEIITIPQFFLVLSLVFLLRSPLRTKDLVLTGVFQGIAILFFQVHVLFIIPVFLRIYFLKENTAFPSKAKAFGSYLLPAAGLPILGYALVLIFNIHPHSLNEAMLWMTKYAHEMSDAWTVPSLQSLKKASIGFSHSIVGGQFLFAVPWFAQHTAEIFGKHELRDEFFLAHSISPIVSELLLVAAAIIALIVIYVVAVSIPSLKKIYLGQKTLLLPILSFFIVYCIFFFVWDPVDFQFWIMQSILGWILLDRMLALSRQKNPKRTAVFRVVLPLLLVSVNFFGSIVLLHNESNDYFYMQSTALAKHVSPRDLIVTDQAWIEGDYYERFAKLPVFSPQAFAKETNSDTLQRRFQQQVRLSLQIGGRVWLSFSLPSRDTTDSVSASFRALWDRTIDTIPIQINRQLIWKQEYEVVSRSQHGVAE
ncbi:MAG: glycosyltransferase family 39 protein [Bacteroidota bacterium]|nr:glycosyltransferase family 39 protein [Bacteroidota bacterium]MDP4228912.1 glycosyltransferase family 39 protein [Bacteroidota bacterium]